MRIVLAFRAFFAVLFNRNRAVEVQKLLAAPSEQIPTSPAQLPSSPVAEQPKSKLPGASPSIKSEISRPLTAEKSSRSDALTLLSALQREARFVDLVQESLDQYSDAQIGAAARDVLRDTKKYLEGAFGLSPLSNQYEGERVEIPESPSPVQWKIVGNAKSSGVLIHPGWVATKVDLPIWNGKGDEKWVVSPTEVEA